MCAQKLYSMLTGYNAAKVCVACANVEINVWHKRLISNKGEGAESLSHHNSLRKRSFLTPKSLGWSQHLARRCNKKKKLLLIPFLGRAIAQAVSRRLPTAAAWVQSNPSLVMWDLAMDKSGAGAGFLRELRFVSPANLHPICYSIIIFTITRGWHNRPGVATVPKVSQTK
jgi:hypothetical protein